VKKNTWDICCISAVGCERTGAEPKQSQYQVDQATKGSIQQLVSEQMAQSLEKQ
jgi:hypothetical protein